MNWKHKDIPPFLLFSYTIYLLHIPSTEERKRTINLIYDVVGTPFDLYLLPDHA